MHFPLTNIAQLNPDIDKLRLQFLDTDDFKTKILEDYFGPLEEMSKELTFDNIQSAEKISDLWKKFAKTFEKAQEAEYKLRSTFTQISKLEERVNSLNENNPDILISKKRILNVLNGIKIKLLSITLEFQAVRAAQEFKIFSVLSNRSIYFDVSIPKNFYSIFQSPLRQGLSSFANTLFKTSVTGTVLAAVLNSLYTAPIIQETTKKGFALAGRSIEHGGAIVVDTISGSSKILMENPVFRDFVLRLTALGIFVVSCEKALESTQSALKKNIWAIPTGLLGCAVIATNDHLRNAIGSVVSPNIVYYAAIGAAGIWAKNQISSRLPKAILEVPGNIQNFYQYIRGQFISVTPKQQIELDTDPPSPQNDQRHPPRSILPPQPRDPGNLDMNDPLNQLD